MKTDMKIGLIIGVVVVLVLIVLLVNRTGDVDTIEPEITVPQTTTVAEPVDKIVEPKAEEPVVQVKEISPPPATEVIPAVKEIDESAVSEPVVVELEIRPDRYYTVAKGDSLSEISESYYGQGKHWKIIYQANRELIKNPDYLVAGWKLRIPYPDEVADKAN